MGWPVFITISEELNALTLYASDIKKLLSWYNILIDSNIDFEPVEAETEDEPVETESENNEK